MSARSSSSPSWFRRLDDFAALWLGWQQVPARRAWEAAIASGWRPDDPEACCPRCASTVGPGEVRAGRCTSCRTVSWPPDATIRLGRYAPPLREWVLQLKFGPRDAGVDRELGRRLAIAVRASRRVRMGRAVVVPMPMPWPRRIARGRDHAAELAAAVGRTLGVPVLPLLRRRALPPQASLPTAERRRQGRRGMILPGASRLRDSLRGLDVVLVDDVCTTGASLAGATRRLRALRPDSVIAAVVAVADPPDRGADPAPGTAT